MATKPATVAAYDRIRAAYGSRVDPATLEVYATWHELLAPLDDDTLAAAVVECCRTLEHPPSPAHLLSAARAASRPAPPHHSFPDEERVERADPTNVASLLEHARSRIGAPRGA
jgi:hypothetical protein